MKILTKEEEQAHYNETVKGGILGGVGGLAVGALGVYAATVRYPAFRQLTLPLRAFLVTSSGTFAAIVSADSWSRSFERSRHPDQQYKDEQQSLQEQIEAQKSTQERAKDWLSDNRYGLVFGSWVASMAAALGIVGRDKYLTGQQKLVQARVYAQGLTLAVVILSLALETSDSARGKGRWETVKILDPNDPTHKHVIEKKIHHEAYAGEDQWRDMIEAEEKRIKEREQAVKARQKDHKGSGNGSEKKNGHEKKDGGEKKDGKKEKKDESGKDRKDETESLERAGKPADEAKSSKLNAP